MAASGRGERGRYVAIHYRYARGRGRMRVIVVTRMVRGVSSNKHASAALVAATETTAGGGGGGVGVGGKRKIGRREIRVGVKIQDVEFIAECLRNLSPARQDDNRLLEAAVQRHI